MKDHLEAISWDEALYFNQVIQDANAIKSGSLHEIARTQMREDSLRPPAYRLLSIPFVLVFGFSPTVVRLVSTGFSIVTLLIVFLATRSIAGTKAGVVATIFLCICPGAIWCGMVFGTEFPLFLAVASTLCFIFVNWNREHELPYSWIGLGISLGLGALSKVTFLMLGFTIVSLSFILSWRRIVTNPSPSFLIKASALGAFLASPWWLLNYHAYLSFANIARTFARHSWSATFFERVYTTFGLLAGSTLGLPVAILLILMFSTLVFSRIRGQDTGIDHKQKTALWICLLPVVILPLMQLTGDNMNPRHLAAALIPMAVVVGVLSQSASWIRMRFTTVICSGLFIAQLLMVIAPTVYPVVYPTNPVLTMYKAPWLVMARLGQWDLEPLRELCKSHGIEHPSVSYLGHSRNLNPAQIAYTWLVHGEEVGTVKWLWRYESGPIDMDRIMKGIGDSDIVLTVLNYEGMRMDKQPEDNQYDNEFAWRLEHDARFTGPIHLHVGSFEPVDMVVFLNAATSISRKQ
jgi:4-amino-4-deoxy-L-arabinose transferase-like glycosyltransferase